MKALWERISDVGTRSELPFSEASRIRISNQMAVMVSLLTIAYFVYDSFFIKENRTQAQLISYYALTIGIGTMFIPVVLLNHLGRYLAARILIITISSCVMFVNTVTLAKPFHTDLYFFGLAAFVFVIFKNIKVIVPVYIFQATAYIISAKAIVEQHDGISDINAGFYVRIVIAFFILFLVLYFIQSETSSYQHEIEVKNLEVSAEHEKIQKMNFTKDKIFSIISHDLRNPIGSLQATLGLLNNDQLNEKEFRKISTELEKQVEQLKISLDEMLTWSKAQLHGIIPQPAITLLRPLVMEVTNVIRLAARKKKIIITTNISPDLKVYCDPTMIKSVITNLITNAIKFTPVGGAISVGGGGNNGEVKINIEDTGIGIPKDNMDKILNPSIHFTTRGTSNEKGTGLGLTMCKEFIQKNNGQLEIESEDGKGSKFIITLPIK